MSEIDQVLDYWFGACGPDGALDPMKRRMWFGDGRKYDDDIRHRFVALHERASRGELAHEWVATPRGRLALIVVLDQFSRHIHRGAPAAFDQDPAAQQLVIAGLGDGVDHALVPAQRVFFYLPLEHAEDLIDRGSTLTVAQDDGAVESFVVSFRVDDAELIAVLDETFQETRGRRRFAAAGRTGDQNIGAVGRKTNLG